MYIVFEKAKRYQKLGDMLGGTVFLDSYGFAFMKLRCQIGSYTAASLDDGELAEFPCDDEFEVCPDATLTL